MFGDDSELLYRPNVTNTTLGDAIGKGFLNEVSDNGVIHRLGIYKADGEITRVVRTIQ